MRDWKFGIAALLLLLLANMALGQSELDLPVLPPDDPRRVEQSHQAEPPQPPQTPEPVAPPVFFGEVIDTSESIVYVLDYSQSMSAPHVRTDYRTTLNRWQVTQREATRSISGLSESIKFDVVVFGTNGGCGVSLWKKSMVVATPSAKAEAIAWIHKFTDVIFLGGATPTGPAVLVALQLGPDTIVLLTDGYPSQCGVNPGTVPWISHRRLIAEHNSEPVPIHTFGIGISISYAREFCMGVASDSGGTFVEIQRTVP